MNKEALAEALQLQDLFADQSKKRTKEFVEDFFGIIATAVSEGNTVSIAGFGKFEPFERANRTIVPKFRPFLAFKNSVAS